MTLEALKFINQILTEAGVAYEYQEWTSEFEYPYWVGEYTESESLNEDGMQPATFMLTGTTDGNYRQLEEDKAKIKEACDIETILPNGNGLAISYAGSLNVPTGNAKMKRIQVNLEIKEWEVN